ncbi:hypothetical protein ACHAXM_002359 [Skeletonema potamos]
MLIHLWWDKYSLATILWQ